jgi:hypothetical protein
VLGQLARTGSDLKGLGALGAVVAAGGAAVVWSARERDQQPHFDDRDESDVEPEDPTDA